MKKDSYAMPAEVATGVLANPLNKATNSFRKELRAARAQYHVATAPGKTEDDRNRKLARDGSFSQLNKWTRRAVKKARENFLMAKAAKPGPRKDRLTLHGIVLKNRAEHLMAAINLRTGGNYEVPSVS